MITTYTHTTAADPQEAARRARFWPAPDQVDHQAGGDPGSTSNQDDHQPEGERPNECRSTVDPTGIGDDERHQKERFDHGDDPPWTQAVVRAGAGTAAPWPAISVIAIGQRFAPLTIIARCVHAETVEQHWAGGLWVFAHRPRRAEVSLSRDWGCHDGRGCPDRCGTWVADPSS